MLRFKTGYCAEKKKVTAECSALKRSCILSPPRIEERMEVGVDRM